MIYLYILQKNVLSKNLWNKNKTQKKTTLGNIGYNSRDICTYASVFALKYFLLIQSNLSLAQYLLLAAPRRQLSKKKAHFRKTFKVSDFCFF